MSREFYHQLEDWIFVPELEAVAGRGRKTIVLLDPAGRDTLDIVEAEAGTQLTNAPDGLHYGVMRFRDHVVGRFELWSLIPKALRWTTQDAGHYYYKIGPRARTVVGHSTVGHPGTTDIDGQLVLYDPESDGVASHACRPPATIRFSGDGSVLLVHCPEEGLTLIDSVGNEVLALEGAYRDAHPGHDGSFVAVVPVDEPTILRIERPGRELNIPLHAPISELAVAPDERLVIAGAGNLLLGMDPISGGMKWRHVVGGDSARIVSISAASRGLVAAGVLLESGRRGGGLIPAAVELLREGTLLHRVEFEIRDPDAWVPMVFLSAEAGRLVVHDQATVWNLPLGSLLEE
ncbi:MAG: hypothetical protein ACRELU_05255 [Gemmatimonadota bacterium]